MEHKKGMAPGIFTIHPRYTLQQHWLFWWPIAALLLIAIITAVPKFCWCWPNNAYEQILNNMKLPFLIASLAIPVSVAIGRFHGAAQRKLSNEIAETNQSFSHYFEHRKFFTEDLNTRFKLESQTYPFFRIASPSFFYEFAFPCNSMKKTDYSKSYAKSVKVALRAVDDAFSAAERVYQAFRSQWEEHPNFKEANFHSPKKSPSEFYDLSIRILDNFLKELGLKREDLFITETRKELPHNVCIFQIGLDSYVKALRIAATFDEKKITDAYTDTYDAIMQRFSATELFVTKLGSIISSEIKLGPHRTSIKIGSRG